MGDAGKKGMDSGKVRAIAQRLDAAHRDLTAAAQKADRAASVLEGGWHGSDAQDFFSTWPANRRALEDVGAAVDAMRTTLRQQLRDQEVTSEVAGAGHDSDGDGTPDDRDPDDDGDGTPDDRDPDDDGDGTDDDEDEDDDSPVKGSADVPVRERGGDTDDRDYTDRGDPDGRDGRGGDDGDDHDRSYRNKDGEDWERGRDYQRTWGDEPGDHKAGEHASEHGRPGYEAQVNVVQGQYDHTFGPSGTLGDRDGNYLGYDVAQVEAEGHAGATFDENGARVGAGVSAAAMAASVSAQYKNSYGTTASGKAYVGAEANADVGLGLGKQGLEAGAHAEAFAGGKAEGNVSQSVGPVDVGVGGEVSYGIGAHADIDAGITQDHVGVSVDIGATLGLGAGVKFDIGFDPPDLPDIDLNPFS